jgi:hypothetical protein
MRRLRPESIAEIEIFAIATKDAVLSSAAGTYRICEVASRWPHETTPEDRRSKRPTKMAKEEEVPKNDGNCSNLTVRRKIPVADFGHLRGT